MPVVVRNFCDSESVRRPYKPDVQQIKLRPHKNGCQCKSCYCGCTHTVKLLLWLHTHFHIVIVAAHALPNYRFCGAKSTAHPPCRFANLLLFVSQSLEQNMVISQNSCFYKTGIVREMSHCIRTYPGQWQ